MSAAATANPVAVLRRAALLVGLLAVMAGFLGMHIIAGAPGLHAHPAGHSSHGADGTFSQPSDGAAAAVTAPAVTPASSTVGGTQVPPSCTCQGACAETPAVHVGCTPSPAGASLSTPQPRTTLEEAQPWTAARADRLSGYAYLPGTPTPRDLSISRT